MSSGRDGKGGGVGVQTFRFKLLLILISSSLSLLLALFELIVNYHHDASCRYFFLFLLFNVTSELLLSSPLFSSLL